MCNCWRAPAEEVAGKEERSRPFCPSSLLSLHICRGDAFEFGAESSGQCSADMRALHRDCGKNFKTLLPDLCPLYFFYFLMYSCRYKCAASYTSFIYIYAHNCMSILTANKDVMVHHFKSPYCSCLVEKVWMSSVDNQQSDSLLLNVGGKFSLCAECLSEVQSIDAFSTKVNSTTPQSAVR